MTKKGELTTKHLVEIILIAMGLAILLFFYWQISWTGQVDREACRQSVVLRGTLPGYMGVKNYIPLKCKTDKICITSGLWGGNCTEFKGETGISYVRVNNIQQIEKTIAQNIVDCWSMMGEGKVNVQSQWLVQTYAVGDVLSSCAICSRIAFDMNGLKKARINEAELAKINVYEYMRTHAVPDRDVSYLDYIGLNSDAKVSINGIGSDKIISAFSKLQVSEDGKITIKEDNSGIETNAEKVDISTEEQKKEIGVMFMQITAPKHSEVFMNTVYTLFGGLGVSFALAPSGTVNVIKETFSNPYSAVGVLAIGAIFGAYQQINTAWNRAITAGYCSDVSVGDSARDGCSVVRTVTNDASDVTKYCNIIESIP